MRRWLAASIVLATAGCTGLTQLMVVVDSDLAVPGELDSLRISVQGPSGVMREADASLVGERALGMPRSLGIVHDGGALGPLVIEVRGIHQNREIVARRARVSFVPGEVRVLRMDLLRSCVGVDCGADGTCGDHGCRPPAVDPDELEPWTGTVEKRDAGAHASNDACVAAAEVCNGRDDDCDGRVDEGFDLASDDRNCGACERECATEIPDAPSRCEGGECLRLCREGWADCNGLSSDGCETPLGTMDDCSACGERCPVSAPNASGSVCTGTGCQLICDSGWGDCNSATADGCEASLTTLSNCGACGSECARDRASATCEGGVCRIGSCLGGWGDCDLVDANGCETSLRTLADCGACGQACFLDRAAASCETGACRIVSCHDGYRDCDGLQPNGCETSLRTLTDCGTCGAICSLANANETCAALECAISSCQPGYADCDEATSSGCETNLQTNRAHCGSCNTACLLSESCCDGACCDGTCCGGSCCPMGRACCGTTCCAFGESCVDGSCRRSS